MPSSWEERLEEVARERWSRLLARAALVTPTRADAEDLVQDALVATFAGRARFATVAEAEQYVRRAIVTRSVDRVRSTAAERRALERHGARRALPDELVTTGLDRDVVEALQTLTPWQRACVVLRHVDDLSVEQTATALGLSPGSVKRYTSDGTSRLQAALGATSDAPETVPVELVDRQETRRD